MSAAAAKPLVLGIDTAGRRSGIGLATATGPLESSYLSADEPRGEALGSEVARMLERASLSAADLTGIGVVVGPGSYTGLRIGLALARGVALVDDLPVVGVGALELLALAYEGDATEILAVLPASAERFYAGGFALDRSASLRVTETRAPEVVTLEELGRRAVQERADGSGCLLCESSAREAIADAIPEDAEIEISTLDGDRAALVAAVALERIKGGQGRRAREVLPLYVGETRAKRNRNKVVTGSVVAH